MAEKHRVKIVLLLTVFILLTARTLLAAPTALQAAEPGTEATEAPLAELKGMFDVGGRSLYIECLGTGSPTIVIETGEGGEVADFMTFHRKLAARTMTCVYERANNGRSDPAPTPRTATDVADDLHALLAAAQVPGPYLLLGHSAGGLFVQLYARTYPDQVVGVVAMNPVPPATPWLEGVKSIFTEDEYASEQLYYRGENGESLDYLASSEQLDAAPEPPVMPFEMLISTDIQCDMEPVCKKSYALYERIMQGVAAKWPNGNFSEVAAMHDIYESSPNEVIAIVERILAAPPAPPPEASALPSP